MRSILGQVHARAIVHTAANEPQARALADCAPLVSLEEASQHTPDEALLRARREEILDIDPVYVLFTSGSTGTPKGIVIPHRAILDFTAWMTEFCGYTEDEVFGNQAPFYFDLSGKDVLMTLKPAEADTGIVFVRTDLPGRPEIKALPENVSSTVKATTLSANGAEVFTVEHLMGALSMMAIDNIRIEMSSPEPPVTDGSAKVFCELIEKAEPMQQEAERHIYAVDKAFSVYDNDRYFTL